MDACHTEREPIICGKAATGDNGELPVRNQITKMEGNDFGKRREYITVSVPLSPISSFIQKLFAALDMPLVCL